jgi:hypothetical protein
MVPNFFPTEQYRSFDILWPLTSAVGGGLLGTTFTGENYHYGGIYTRSAVIENKTSRRQVESMISMERSCRASGVVEIACRAVESLGSPGCAVLSALNSKGSSRQADLS